MKLLKNVQRSRFLSGLVLVLVVVCAAQAAHALIRSYTNKPIGHLSFKNSNELKTTSSIVPARVGPDTKVVFNPTSRSIVQASFCAELSSAGGAGVIAVAILDPGTGDEVVIDPGTIVLDSALDANIETRCFQWDHYFVEAGAHVLEIHWASTVDTVAVESRRRTLSVVSR